MKTLLFLITLVLMLSTGCTAEPKSYAKAFEYLRTQGEVDMISDKSFHYLDFDSELSRKELKYLLKVSKRYTVYFSL
jgi:hypothetical protein